MDVDENRPTPWHVAMKFQSEKTGHVQGLKNLHPRFLFSGNYPRITTAEQKEEKQNGDPKPIRSITEQKKASEHEGPGKTAVLRSYQAMNLDQSREAQMLWQTCLRDKTERMPKARERSGRKVKTT